MNSVLEWVTVLVILYNVGTAGIIWAVRRASKDDVTRVDRRCEAMETRVSNLEEMGKLLPTREDLHLLRLEMMKSNGRLRKFTAELAADRRQFQTEIEGARVYFGAQIESTEKLVQRTEVAVRIVTEHLLNRGG